jgi:cytochrome c-type protein NapC
MVEVIHLSLFRRIWETLTRPSSRLALGTLVGLGLLLGGLGVMAFNATLHATNTNEFCVSCHELEENALAEFVGTPHHTNASGKVATCGDCHVPKEFVPKMIRKVRAIGEVYHHLKGTIDTPEKYDEHRMWMATKTWAYMNERDSQECRNCHDEGSWDLELQTEKARKYHSGALSRGKTCIDCHKGLAHKLPPGIVEDEQIEGIDF